MIRMINDDNVLGNEGKVVRMPIRVMGELFGDIKRELTTYLDGRVYDGEIGQAVNEIVYRQLARPRGNGEKHFYKPLYIGQYFVDPSNPNITRPVGNAAINHSQPEGTGQCTELPITEGVIGQAIRTGERVYVPDTSAPGLDHKSCDERSEKSPVSELVIITWSRPYTRENPNWTEDLDGMQVPIGATDIDLLGKDVMSVQLMAKLDRTYRKIEDKLFRDVTWFGQANFRPVEEMAIRDAR